MNEVDWTNTRHRYEQELLDSVIPFWQDHCVDEKHGGYFTYLDRDGSVYDTDKYMWMQWRIVYMFAILFHTPYGKSHDEWLNIAQNGYNFLTKHGKDPAGNYYFALARDGTPIIAPYNIYSEAFAVMGAAALYRATKKNQYKEEALSAMDHYLTRLNNPKLQWNKILLGKPRMKSLGVYMILANMGAVLNECLNITDYQAEVQRAVDIVMHQFWDPNHGVILENVKAEGDYDLNSTEGRHFIPGHGLESLWFVLQYAERTGHQELIQDACSKIKKLFRKGWDPEHGGIFYLMDVLGKPHVELHWDMKLWWVHNEASIATLYGYRLTKDPELLTLFQQVDDWAWGHFRDPEFGEWFGYLNRTGESTHSLKGGRWKTFFHLPRYLLTGLDLMAAL